MKSIFPFLFLLLSTGILLFSGCTNYAKINKDLLAGYSTYQDCLKNCDALEKKYTDEYNACYQNCPPEEPPAACVHITDPMAQLKCISQHLDEAVACAKCAQDYINHMKEVDACRKESLTAYNNLQSVYLP